MVPAIEISHLCKSYRELRAVDDVSLRVEAGDFFGFLGPNGAGKTTTINAVVGLAKYQSGSIRVFGHDAAADWRAARRLIGLAPQEYNFDRYLSIRDVLLYQAGYFGLRPRDVRARADELLERFELTSKAGVEYTKLSGGMKRRLSLARALVHSPKLLILDEPTAGVDVELRLELWELLRSLNAGGMTIFLTTHYLEEAESLCRTIAIIEGGKVVACAPTAELLARQGGTVLRVTVDPAAGVLPPALVASGARTVGERTVEIDGVAPSEIATTLAALESAGYAIVNVEFARSTLQDVFLDLVRR